MMTEIEKYEVAKNRGWYYDGCSVKNKNGSVGFIKNNYHKISISIDKKSYSFFAHRFAWYYRFNQLPLNTIDHIDGNSMNNNIDNLRDVSHQRNCFNFTKAKGYCYRKDISKFRAEITLNAKNIHLGYFEHEVDARKAYLHAKKNYHKI